MSEAWKQYEGQVVDGKFHLRQYLGSSDHSAVFLTEPAPPGAQRAAIKFISADPPNSDRQILRWQQTAKLSHPHLIQILQTGRCHLGGRDLLFVVTEFAEENLSQILPHRALTAGEAGDMLPPVLDALAYLHGKSLIHGHLKPANIMAVRDQLKISSDGLCGVGETVKGPQQPGLYNAPESSTGMQPASDVWSLGMTLVEVLTQRPLLWDGAMRGEPVVPETVSAPFRNIASHCLRQDPQRRWTLGEIAAGSRAPAGNSLTQQAAERSRPSRQDSSGWFTKSRMIGPIVAVAVLVVAIVGGAKLLNRRPEPKQDSSSAAPSSQPSLSTEPAERRESVRAEPAKPGLATPEQTHGSSRAARHSSKTAKSSAGAGSVVQQVLPEVSSGARRTIQGRIRVRVRVDVDSSGSVVGAHFESEGPSKYFANKALDAARRWKFEPAKVNGQAAASVWVLKFAIGRTSTTVESVQTKP